MEFKRFNWPIMFIGGAKLQHNGEMVKLNHDYRIIRLQDYKIAELDE
jgi:hypothetical protein